MASPRRHLPSLSTPIIMASIAVPIAVALLTGWTLVFARNLAEGDDVAQNVWLLVLGVIAFMALMSVMIMFAVFLGREILEVRRQDSFIDSVTHELRSPLASLKLGLQTLGREGLPEEKREMMRSMMLDDVDRLSAFVDDILQASRLAHVRDKVGMDLGAKSEKSPPRFLCISTAILIWITLFLIRGRSESTLLICIAHAKWTMFRMFQCSWCLVIDYECLSSPSGSG